MKLTNLETLLKIYVSSDSFNITNEIDEVSTSEKGWPEEINSLLNAVEVIQNNE